MIQKRADVIYRVRGTDIQNNLYKVFAIINTLDGHLFNDEYSHRLGKIDFDNSWYKKRHYFDYQTEDDRSISSMIELKRKQVKKDFDGFWFKYALYSMICDGRETL